MKNDDRFGELEALDSWQLVHDEQDIRGCTVASVTGARGGVAARCQEDLKTTLQSHRQRGEGISPAAADATGLNPAIRRCWVKRRQTPRASCCSRRTHCRSSEYEYSLPKRPTNP